VGASQKSKFSHLKRSSLNLGNWPVPKRLAELTRKVADLGVAMLASVHVEHEVDEGAFQAGAEAPVDRETARP